MTVDIKKKHIIIALSILAILLVGYFGYNSYRTSQYEKNAGAFKENAYKLYIVSSNICSQINSVWSGYIFDDKHYFGPKTGNSFSSSYCYSSDYQEDRIYCSNFSEMIMQEEKFLTRKGFHDLLNEYKNGMKEAFEKMTPAPSKYKECHATMQKMYNAANALYNAATNPDGSLQSYASSIHDADKQFIEAIEQSEIEICPIEGKRMEYQATVIKAVNEKLGSIND